MAAQPRFIAQTDCHKKTAANSIRKFQVSQIINSNNVEDKTMNRAKSIIAVVLFLGMLAAAWAQEAEFRTVIVRNDQVEGGELLANLEFRLPGASAAKTLASVHTRYSEDLAAWPDVPVAGHGCGTGYATGD